MMQGQGPPTSHWRAATVLLVVFFSAFAKGCIYIPGPEWTVVDGTRVNSEELEFIQVGTTDRTTVEEQLGPPAFYWVDFHAMIYHWTVLNGIFILATPAGGDVAMTSKEYLLMIQLDPENRVLRYGIIGGDPITLGFFTVSTRRNRIKHWLAGEIEQEHESP